MVGGLAVIGAVVLGAIYIRHRAKKAAQPPSGDPPPQVVDGYRDDSYPAEMAAADVKGGWSPELDGGGASPIRFAEVLASPVGVERRAELG